MSIDGITPTLENSLKLPGAKGGTMRVAQRSGDAAADRVSLSHDALNVAESDGIRANKVFAKMGDKNIIFDNTRGTVDWGGTRLNLKAIGNTLKDDMIVEKAGTGFRVMNYTDNTQLMLDSNGQPVKNALGKPDVTHEFVGPSTQGALFISNKEWGGGGTSYNDVMINRKANAEIWASSGDDKIFNLNSRVKTINAVAGNNAVYSVGLRAGAHIDMSNSDSSYVKLLGTAQGATISLGGSTGVLDAKGKRVANSTIQTTGTMAESFVALGTLDGGSMTLNATHAAVDARRITGSRVNLGSGKNSVVVDTLAGRKGEAANTVINGAAGSRNTVHVGALNNATLDLDESADNAVIMKRNSANAVISLGAGKNSVDAGKRTLHNILITSNEAEEPDPSAPPDSGATAGSTAIKAGKITADAKDGSRIALGGNGNSVSVTGLVRNADIALGTGSNTFAAGSVSNLNLQSGGDNSTAAQSVTVKGNATNLNYTGSAGKDAVNVGGMMRGGAVNLGDGENAMTVTKGVRETGIDAAEDSTNAITAASYWGKGDSDMALGNGGNTLNIKGQVRNADISLGGGANTFTSGAMGGLKGVTIHVASGTTHAQSVTVMGAANKLTYEGGNGNDAVSVRGNISNSEINLRGGNNSVAAGLGDAGGQLRGVDITAEGTGATSIRAASIRNGLNQYTRVSLGDGGNSMSLRGSVSGNTNIDMGTGENRFSSGSILGTAQRDVQIVAGGAGSTMAQNVFVHGKANHLTYTGSDGKDTFHVRDGLRKSNVDLRVEEHNESTASVAPDDPNAGIGGNPIGDPANRPGDGIDGGPVSGAVLDGLAVADLSGTPAEAPAPANPVAVL